MTKLVTDNLHLLAGAPNGISGVRGLILDLALRGKLTCQDASDEPATELLGQIHAERARLVAAGSIRKVKDGPAPDVDVMPFGVPNGWEWASLASLVIQITDGTHHTPTYLPSGIPFISVKDIDGKTVEFSNCKYISPQQHAEINARCNPELGDVLLCRIGTLGRPTIVDTNRPFSIFVSVGLLKLPKSVQISRYLHAALSSPLLYRQYDQIKAGGSHTNKLNLGDIPRLMVPVPPLAEQHRVVAKVDELMALCDRLEAEQADAEAAHDKLVAALLASLTQARDTADFRASWQQLAEHFHTLFTSEASVDALEEAILEFAASGRLTQQHPSDGTSESLIAEINERRASLIAEERLRTSARSDIPLVEQYSKVPVNWRYCRLGNLARFIDYRGKTPVKTSSGVPLITAKNVRFGYISREPREFIAPEVYASWMTRGIPRPGDMLFTTEAPLGNIAIIDIAERFALAQRVICFQLHRLEIGPFLRIALMSKSVQSAISQMATGMTAAGVKASKLKELPIPLPPLAEQQRIVAMVDQLMALCTSLKREVAIARQHHERLASELVEQAVA